MLTLPYDIKRLALSSFTSSIKVAIPRSPSSPETDVKYNLTNNSFVNRLLPLKRFQSSCVAALREETEPRVNGAQLIFELLKENNVISVSGYSGGAVLPLIDVFANPPNGYSAIPFYLHANEAAAGHSAEAMAKVTGNIGCCVVTSGPGITNCVTPMQDAHADGVPMLFISGQVPTSAVGKEAFQEVAATEVSRPVTKWTFCVTDVRDIGWVMDRAIRIATTGRPGPVHVDIPKDILTAMVPREFDPHFKQPKNTSNSDMQLHGMLGSIYPDEMPIGQTDTSGSLNDVTDSYRLQSVVELLENCQKPLLHIGAGGATSADSIRAIAEFLAIPVSSTLHGMGIFSERNCLSLGMIGMHGSVYGNYAMQEADLIIGLGTRFDDRTTGSVQNFAPNAYAASKNGTGGVVHFDIEPSMFGKSGVIPTLSILGDLKKYAPRLLELIKSNPRIEKKKMIWRNWNEQVLKWKQEFPFFVEKYEDNRFTGKAAISLLNQYLEDHNLGDDKIICTGVGNHQMYACQLMTWSKERQFVSSGGLGTMGVGLPFAIGSKIAMPDKRVILLDGDGSFNMSSSDLQTVTRYQLPIAIFIFNDGKQSMVSSWQDFFFEGRQYITTNTNPNYATLASAHGIKSYVIDNAESLNTLLPEIMDKAHHEPVVIDCQITSDYAFPICPPGTKLEDTYYTLNTLVKAGTQSGEAPS